MFHIERSRIFYLISNCRASPTREWLKSLSSSFADHHRPSFVYCNLEASNENIEDIIPFHNDDPMMIMVILMFSLTHSVTLVI